MKAILFDIDGTLLPMDQDVFTKSYFGALVKHMAPHGYEAEELINAVWAGTERMVLNDGRKMNEEVFWEKFGEIYGQKGIADKPLFDEFYAKYFGSIKASCGFNSAAREAVDAARERGLRVIIATNPIFPEEANKQRLGWAGLDPDSFEYISSYENSRFSKPNPLYFGEIAEKRGLSPADCLMVGNDVGEDSPALKAGMDFFLLTDCMINKKNSDVSAYKRGGFAELIKYIETL